MDNKEINQEVKEEVKTSNNSRTTIVLIICVALLVVVLLGIILFLKLNKDDSNNEKNSSVNNQVNNLNENNIGSEKENNSNSEFLDFKTVFMNSKDNIIGKTKNNEWIQIVEGDKYLSILGIYQNKLYYHDDNGLGYVDLNNEKYEPTTWINYENNGIDDVDKIFTAVMVNDKVYFSKCNLGSGLFKISINETSFNNAIEVLPDVVDGGWIIDIENQILYYIDYYNNNEGLYKLDLKTNKIEKIFESEIDELELCNNYIVYSTVGEQERLYLYDLKSKRNILVSDTYISGNAVNKLQIYNNDFYYIDNGKLIKYNNGSKDIIYTQDNLLSFFILDDNLIELELYYVDEEKTEELYLIDGKISKESPERVIHMKNGEIKKIAF